MHRDPKWFGMQSGVIIREVFDGHSEKKKFRLFGDESPPVMFADGYMGGAI
jgi:hypothetical protein